MSLAAAALLYDADGARALDRQASATLAISGFSLMQRAAAAAFAELRRRWPQARRVGIVCGTGNNGGDGCVIAALAHAAGLKVDLVLVGDTARIVGDAAHALELAHAAGLAAAPWTGTLAPADVIVDALFGTGLDRIVDGAPAAAIAAINAAGCPVLAIDVPSGLDATSGRVLGSAVQASVTVSFIALKQGLSTGAGPAHCGVLIEAALEVPAACFAAVPASARRLDYAAVHRHFTPRSRTAHKGDFGHVLVVGGGPGCAGAARLAAEAAARVGAGLVTLATHPAHAGMIGLARPEIMCHGVADAAALRVLLARANVIAIGPGLGQAAWGRALFALVRDVDLPRVFDADALNLLAADPAPLTRAILTPHPGEAARLLGVATTAIAEDRFAAARDLARRYSAVALLKGAGTLIQAPAGLPWVIGGGNPGMASGGMGDVLTGIIAGLVAQGHALDEAAAIGACVHAEAGDRAAAVGGERGLLAGDLLDCLRAVVNPAA